MQTDTTAPEFNNKDNINIATQSLLDTIMHLTKRADVMRDVRWALDNMPDYIEVPSNMYDYSQYDLRFTLHLPDDTNNEQQWRENARKIHAARKFFNIKKLSRTVSEDGSVYYTGKGWIPDYQSEREARDITLVVPHGGLPPTCTIEIVEEEVTATYKHKVVKTNCAPRHQHEAQPA